MKTFLLNEKSAELEIGGITKSEGWINFNPSGVGYFLILYLGEYKDFVHEDQNLSKLWGNEGIQISHLIFYKRSTEIEINIF